VIESGAWGGVVWLWPGAGVSGWCSRVLAGQILVGVAGNVGGVFGWGVRGAVVRGAGWGGKGGGVGGGGGGG